MPELHVEVDEQGWALLLRASACSEHVSPDGFAREAAMAAAHRRLALADAAERAVGHSRGVFQLVDHVWDEASGMTSERPVREGGDPVPATAPLDEDELRQVLREARGGTSSVRDQAALDMVLAEHAQCDGMDVFDQAAALLVGLARFEPFARGNRKAAWAAPLAWLDLCGLRLYRRFDDEFAASIVRRASEGALDADEVAERLRAAALGRVELGDETEER